AALAMVEYVAVPAGVVRVLRTELLRVHDQVFRLDQLWIEMLEALDGGVPAEFPYENFLSLRQQPVDHESRGVRMRAVFRQQHILGSGQDRLQQHGFHGSSPALQLHNIMPQKPRRHGEFSGGQQLRLQRVPLAHRGRVFRQPGEIGESFFLAPEFQQRSEELLVGAAEGKFAFINRIQEIVVCFRHLVFRNARRVDSQGHDRMKVACPVPFFIGIALENGFTERREVRVEQLALLQFERGVGGNLDDVDGMTSRARFRQYLGRHAVRRGPEIVDLEKRVFLLEALNQLLHHGDIGRAVENDLTFALRALDKLRLAGGVLKALEVLEDLARGFAKSGAAGGMQKDKQEK